MKIKETAELAGITVRSLHYYDRIGLLRPKVTESGYREYSREDLERLWQILFFRELEFPLKEIKRLLDSPGYDREHALRSQRELLQKKVERVERIIAMIDTSLKGEREMSFKEFDQTEIEEMKEQYEREVLERWGHTEAYRESRLRDPEKLGRGVEGAEGIFRRFAALSGGDPGSPEAQSLVREWQAHITENFYSCTAEILGELGRMYLEDGRFSENLDAYGPGTARFMADAIAAYNAGLTGER